jgi:hypothetical protein
LKWELEDNLSEHWRRDDLKTNVFSGVVGDRDDLKTNVFSGVVGDRDGMSKDGGSINVLKNSSDILLQNLV